MPPSMRTLLIAADGMTTSVVTRLIRLPDIPGQVVEVRRVTFGLTSFSSTTAVTVVFHHNIELSITLSVGDFTDAWGRITGGAGGGSESAFFPMVFDPPLELIGAQRMDYQLSAGTGEGLVMVSYTVRPERNRTVWNALRARTSFEKG